MKKSLSIISVTLALSLLFAAFCALTAHAEGPEYTKKDVTTYVFSIDNVKTTSCVFSSLLPEAPYIDPVDFLSTVYINEFSQTKNEDGTFTVSAPRGTLTADAVNDILYSENFEAFSANDNNNEGSSVNINFVEGISSEFIDGVKALTLDLGKYGIDIIEYEGRVYLPLATICIMFAQQYSNAEYIDGNLYYLHSMENMSKDGYFDKSTLYNTLTRSEAMAVFTYNHLCFAADCFFGKPTNALIGAEIAEKGLDKTLDEYDDTTRIAKEMLLSTDKFEYMAALCILSYYFNDGGHTALYADPMGESANYQDSAFFSEFVEKIKSDDPKFAAAMQGYRKAVAKQMGKPSLLETRNTAYSNYEKAVSWDDSAYLLVEGDTAVFVFDSFAEDSVKQFREALNYAKEHNVKNFVIDVSGNGGGFVVVAYYMVASMLAKNTKSNEFSSYALNTATGNIRGDVLKFDLNGDGVINDDDNEVSYDFNFSLLTSRYSFSSGNILPVLAHEYGIAVFGEVSGGGACSIEKIYFPDAHYIYMSSCNKFYVLSGADVDLGAPVDSNLTVVNDEDGSVDYSGMYDISRLGELTKDFYACKEHIPGEPVKENVKDPACNDEGTYDEVIYCTVCGEEISRQTKHSDALGHKYGEWEVTKAPTKTGTGEKVHTCERCGHTETEVIPATGEEQSPPTGEGFSVSVCVILAVLSVAGTVIIFKQRKKSYVL